MIDRALFGLDGIRAVLCLMGAFAAARAALAVGQAWTLASAVVALWGDGEASAQLPLLAGFVACFAGGQMVRSLQDAYLSRYAARQADALRDRALEAVFREGPRLVQEQGTGNVCTLVLEGADQVETYLRLILPRMVAVVVVPLVILACTAPCDWVSALIMLVVFPVIVFYMVLLGKTAKAAASAQHREYQRLSNHFVDSLRGMDTLKLFGRGKEHAARIFEVSERFREATVKTLRIATLSGSVLDLASTLSLAAVAIMLGFRLVDGSVAFFPALFVLVLVPEYFKPVREFASDYHASLDGKNALASLTALAARAEDPRDAEAEGQRRAPAAGAEDAAQVRDTAAVDDMAGCGPLAREGRPDAADAEDAAQLQGTAAADGALRAVAAAAADGAEAPRGGWSGDDVFEARSVRFSYADGPALRDVSFSVRGCARVGIVGASGSGKSTLVRMLAGFAAPSSGSFFLAGRELSDLRDPWWQHQAVYLPQNPYLFHATLRDNVAFYRPDATDDEVLRAVEAAGLDEVASSLPDGLDTLVGEGGRALSGGQAQRVALARAFLDGSRRVLLLDEPTAHLDVETEWELKERMLPLMEGRLVFFATHRLHWMRDFDLVVVMEDGRAVEFGAPEELAGRGGVFSRLLAQREGGAR